MHKIKKKSIHRGWIELFHSFTKDKYIQNFIEVIPQTDGEHFEKNTRCLKILKPIYRHKIHKKYTMEEFKQNPETSLFNIWQKLNGVQGIASID